MPNSKIEYKKTYQHEVVKDVTNLLCTLGYQNCAKRIEFLHNYDDFEEGEHPLSLESTESFLSFIRDSDFFREINKSSAPLIGLFPEGTLSAEWRTSDNNNHLLIEFHPDDIISFAMIEDGTVHIDGHGPYKTIIDTLRKQGVTNWEMR